MSNVLVSRASCGKSFHGCGAGGGQAGPRRRRGRRRRRAQPVGALDRRRAGYACRRLAADRARGGRLVRQERRRRRSARYRDARSRRHLGAAAAAAKEARPHRHHGLDLHAPQRRDQLARAGARRRRLYSEARKHARSHDLGVVPARAFGQGSRARPSAPPLSARPGSGFGAAARAGCGTARRTASRAADAKERNARAAPAGHDPRARSIYGRSR